MDENLAWTDPRNDEPHLGADADPLRYILAKPIAAPPDRIWTYNGGGTDCSATSSNGSRGNRCKPSPARRCSSHWHHRLEWKTYPTNGKIAAAVGLRLRPRDAAKLGQLVLNPRVWDGRQIVPAAWIAQSTAPRFQPSVTSRFVLLRLSVVARPHAFGGKEVTWVAPWDRAASASSSFPSSILS